MGAAFVSLYTLRFKPEQSPSNTQYSKKWIIIGTIWVFFIFFGLIVRLSANKIRNPEPATKPQEATLNAQPPSLRKSQQGIRLFEETTGPDSGWFVINLSKIEGEEKIRDEKIYLDQEIELEYDISRDLYSLYLGKMNEPSSWFVVPLKKRWFSSIFYNDKHEIEITFHGRNWWFEQINESNSTHVIFRGQSKEVAVFSHRVDQSSFPKNFIN
jgi:hypothetical protein